MIAKLLYFIDYIWCEIISNKNSCQVWWVSFVWCGWFLVALPLGWYLKEKKYIIIINHPKSPGQLTRLIYHLANLTSTTLIIILIVNHFLNYLLQQSNKTKRGGEKTVNCILALTFSVFTFSSMFMSIFQSRA